MSKIYSHTQSLCNTCQQKIPARIIEKEGKVFMEKVCPEHGRAETLISSDKDWYESSLSYVKPGQIPLKFNKNEFTGCPDSCGFCNEHQQHTCLPVIEINYNCDLNCPVCLKGEASNFQMSASEFEGIIDNLIATEGSLDVANISGGEPCLHPELMQFCEIAIARGITQISVSTNGLELLNNKKLREKFKELGIIAAIQFDGFDDNVYKIIRGEALVEKKLQLLKTLESEGVPFSLVSTIINGVNDSEIQKITDFFFQSKAFTLMFQPVAFTGLGAQFDPVLNRITIPDIVKEIENSTYVKKGDFNPLPCSHYSCFALAYFLQIENEQYYSMKEFLGNENYLNIIANKTLPGLDNEGYSQMKHRLYELWSAADSGNLNDKVLQRVKNIIKEMSSCGFNKKNALNMGKNHMKAIFIHHFMDVYNFDFSRLIKCCNPYPQIGDKLIPACSQNVIFNNDISKIKTT